MLRVNNICLEFLHKGYCTFGDRCKWNHPGDTKKVSNIETCYDFKNRGYCAYGNRCEFAHDTDSTTVQAIAVVPKPWASVGYIPEQMKCAGCHLLILDGSLAWTSLPSKQKYHYTCFTKNGKFAEEYLNGLMYEEEAKLTLLDQAKVLSAFQGQAERVNLLKARATVTPHNSPVPLLRSQSKLSQPSSDSHVQQLMITSPDISEEEQPRDSEQSETPHQGHEGADGAREGAKNHADTESHEASMENTVAQLRAMCKARHLKV